MPEAAPTPGCFSYPHFYASCRGESQALLAAGCGCGVVAYPAGFLQLGRCRHSALPGFSPALAGLQPGFSNNGFIHTLPRKYSGILVARIGRDSGSEVRQCLPQSRRTVQYLAMVARAHVLTRKSSIITPTKIMFQLVVFPRS